MDIFDQERESLEAAWDAELRRRRDREAATSVWNAIAEGIDRATDWTDTASWADLAPLYGREV